MTTRIQALERLIEQMDTGWQHIRLLFYGIQSDKGWTEPTPHFEFYYFIDGANTLTINGRKTMAAKGDFFFTDRTVSCTCPDSRFTIYYVAFTAEHPAVYSALQDAFSSFTPTGSPIHTPGLETDFSALCSEVSLTKPYHALMIKQHLLGILIKLYRILGGIDQPGSESQLGLKHEKTLDEIAAYIDSHYSEKISLTSLSSRYGLNERYLDRLFKEVTGSTIIEYLIRVRVERAKRLLKATNLSVTDIASETGFYDCAHFSKTFKRLEGKSPAVFRGRKDIR